MELIYVITEMRHETEIYRFSISFEFDGTGVKFAVNNLYSILSIG